MKARKNVAETNLSHEGKTAKITEVRTCMLPAMFMLICSQIWLPL